VGAQERRARPTGQPPGARGPLRPPPVLRRARRCRAASRPRHRPPQRRWPRAVQRWRPPCQRAARPPAARTLSAPRGLRTRGRKGTTCTAPPGQPTCGGRPRFLEVVGGKIDRARGGEGVENARRGGELE
jgi:hypothetical protein